MLTLSAPHQFRSISRSVVAALVAVAIAALTATLAAGLLSGGSAAAATRPAGEHTSVGYTVSPYSGKVALACLAPASRRHLHAAR